MATVGNDDNFVPIALDPTRWTDAAPPMPLLGRLGEVLAQEVPPGYDFNISVKLFIPDTLHMREMLLLGPDFDALTNETLAQAIRQNIAALPKPKEKTDE